MKFLKLSIMLLVCSHAVAQTQDLSFGTNGLLLIDNSQDVYIQGGTIQNNRLLVKTKYDCNGYSLNGIQDLNFGNNGLIDEYVLLINLPTYEATTWLVSSNPNYSIMPTTGYSYITQGIPDVYKFGFLFLDNNGNVNTSIGNSGQITTPFSKDWPIKDVIYNDDYSKIFACLADEDVPPGLADSISIVSANQNGTINTNWGNNGVAFFDYANQVNNLSRITPIKYLYGTNEVFVVTLVTKNDNSRFYSLIRFNSSGQYDSSFGFKNVNQELGLTLNDNVIDMVVENGNIYFLVNYRKIYKRNASTLTVDNSFGVSGVATASPINATFDKIKIIASKVYGIGSAIISNDNRALVTRYLANGTVDQSFMTNGSLQFEWPSFTDNSTFTDVIPNGQNSIYLLGESYLDDGTNDDYRDGFAVKYTTEPNGISETNKLGLKIYPNPAFDVLNIEAKGDYTVKIYTMQGQLIQTHTANNPTRLDVSALAQGVYMAVIENGTGVSRMRFIKQ